MFKGFGKGEGKVQYSCSLSAFNERLKNWQPRKNREVFLATNAAFEGITVPPGEQDRTAIGAMPLDAKALKLAKKYSKAILKKTKNKLLAEFERLYPDSKVSLASLAKGTKLLAKYWDTRSPKKREAILEEYNKISPSNAASDIMIFRASYLINEYESAPDASFRNLCAKNYELLTHGRQIAQDAALISDADDFMREMDKIHDKWAKKGGNDSAEAMKELINGISKFGRKHSPRAMLASQQHEYEMFVNTATFLNLIGEINNAVEVSYKADRFKLEAKGQASVTKKSAASIVENTKKAIEGDK